MFCLSGVSGSSPLTRGKPGPVELSTKKTRLIPAHAGKTPPPMLRSCRPGAHPRSRGENLSVAETPPPPAGSSPLTRGKRSGSSSRVSTSGLIPAHAGKTTTRVIATFSGWAHPRSRGENPGAEHWAGAAPGSSPLTRGKHRRRRPHSAARGLIPAHAGKTTRTPTISPISRAHPRSRGENVRRSGNRVTSVGSSPLTRGKLHARFFEGLYRRLIPAHAGKTGPRQS